MDPSPPVQAVRRKRVGLAVLAILLTVNIWTGVPVLAVWVGSRVAGHSGVSMGALVLVVVVMAIGVFLLTLALGWVSATDDRLSGRPRGARRTSPWLRAMSGEREETARAKYGISSVERFVVGGVAAALVAFEVWFFFFAGSSLPNQ